MFGLLGALQSKDVFGLLTLTFEGPYVHIRVVSLGNRHYLIYLCLV